MFNKIRKMFLKENYSLVKTNYDIKSRKKMFPDAELLYFSDKDPEDINFGMSIEISIDMNTGEIESSSLKNSDDPSTIFTKMEIKETSNDGLNEDIGYYPNYAELKPEQKYIYLEWLYNTYKPINIGFVFIYYYGLEKQLLVGNYEKAFNKILDLRKNHRNKSFLNYSQNGLLSASYYKKDYESFLMFFNVKDFIINDLLLLLIFIYNIGISSEIFPLIVSKIPKANKKYIKDNIDLYIFYTNKTFLEEFGENLFHIEIDCELNDLPKISTHFFSNYSFSDKTHYGEIPSLLSYDIFTEQILELHKIIHEKIKKNK